MDQNDNVAMRSTTKFVLNIMEPHDMWLMIMIRFCALFPDLQSLKTCACQITNGVLLSEFKSFQSSTLAVPTV